MVGCGKKITVECFRFDPDRDAKPTFKKYYETDRAYWWN